MSSRRSKIRKRAMKKLKKERDQVLKDFVNMVSRYSFWTRLKVAWIVLKGPGKPKKGKK